MILSVTGYVNVPDGSAEAAVHALALLARREEDLRLVLVQVVLVPRVAPRYDLGRAHPLTYGDLKKPSRCEKPQQRSERVFLQIIHLCHLPEGVHARAALSHVLPRREAQLLAAIFYRGNLYRGYRIL